MTPVIEGALRLCACMSSIDNSGTVYLITVEERFVKIGFVRARNAAARMAELQVACPFEFKLRIETIGGKPLEQALHALFKDYRVRNEWFRLEGEVLEFVQEFEKKAPKSTWRIQPTAEAVEAYIDGKLDERQLANAASKC